jgi:DNA helicase HerA-like ATPase
MSRADVEQSDRPPYRLLIDEAHNLLSAEAAETLSEGRRMGLSLIISTQFAKALPADLRDSVKVNGHVQVYFQTSSSEASEIAPEVASSLSREELRKVLVSAPVGCAVIVRRGFPSVYVQMPEAPRQRVDREVLRTTRSASLARTTIPRCEAERILTARSTMRAAKAEEVVKHVRSPYTKRGKA